MYVGCSQKQTNINTFKGYPEETNNFAGKMLKKVITLSIIC
jgi:hypothetical protein